MNYNPFSVEGKVIIVTGASSGIGQEISINLSKLGATVCLLGRDIEKLRNTKTLCENSSRHLIFDFDLLKLESRKEFIDALKQNISKIDSLVHCAGISSTIPLRSLSDKKLNSHFAINVNSGFLLIKDLVAKKNSLLQEGSSIVMLSSVMGTVGEIGKTAYAMTKGAIIAGVKSLSLELALKKIRVNAVSPGVVESPMSSKSFYSQNEERLKKIEALHPLGLGQPSDVSHACIYLISEASKWVTGTNLIVDGGYTAR